MQITFLQGDVTAIVWWTGITATLCCFPLDVLRTRVFSTYKSHTRGNPLALLVNIARKEGIPALYVGCAPALVAMVPSGAVYYCLYDALKEQHLNHVSALTGWLLLTSYISTSCTCFVQCLVFMFGSILVSDEIGYVFLHCDSAVRINSAQLPGQAWNVIMGW